MSLSVWMILAGFPLTLTPFISVCIFVCVYIFVCVCVCYLCRRWEDSFRWTFISRYLFSWTLQQFVPVSQKNLVLVYWDDQREAPNQHEISEIFSCRVLSCCVISGLLQFPVDYFAFWALVRVPWVLPVVAAQMIQDFQCCFRQKTWICFFPRLSTSNKHVHVALFCCSTPTFIDRNKSCLYSSSLVETDTNEVKISETFPPFLHLSRRAAGDCGYKYHNPRTMSNTATWIQPHK